LHPRLVSLPDGTPYCRVGEPCFGSEVYSVVEPGFYSKDGSTFYRMGTLDDPTYFDGYNERVDGAPYFFKTHVDGALLAGDMTPLDTSQYVIFVPELNGDGVLYTPEESIKKFKLLNLGIKVFWVIELIFPWTIMSVIMKISSVRPLSLPP